MMCDKYNGWSNYQTWVCNLWYDDFFADDAVEFYHWAKTDALAEYSIEQIKISASYELSVRIKDTLENEDSYTSLTNDASVYSDLMSHAIGMIDFYEIAQAYIDEIIAQEEVTV